MLTVSRCCWQLKYHALSSWENIVLFLTTNFGQAIQNSVRDLSHISPSAQRRATNMPVVCSKMKKSIQNIDLFILFCDKLRSHFQSDWRSYKLTFKRHSIIPHLPRLPLRSQIFFFFFHQFGAWFQAKSWQLAAFIVHFRQGCSCFASAIKHCKWKSNNYPLSYAMHDSVGQVLLSWNEFAHFIISHITAT